MENSILSNDNVVTTKKTNGYKKRLIKKIKIFFLLALVLATSFIISVSLKKTVNLSYKENSNINYLVYLKQNDYYADPYLTKGMQYIASLIDYVDVNFNYNFKMNDQIKYNYYYYIEADVKVFEDGNPANIIYEKRSKLVDNKIYKDQTSLDFNIDENLKINYGEYNDLIRAFKTSYNIAADSSLTLTLYVYIDGEYEDFKQPIRTQNTMNLVIPLTEQMININMDYKEVNNSDVIKLTSNDGMLNKIFLGISIFTSALLLISIIDLVRYLLKIVKRKTPYQKKIEAIIREYDRVIVEVSDGKLLSNETSLIKVSSFEELLDVSDKLQLPILHYEQKKLQKSVFMVRKDNDAYYFVITSKDVDGDE